MSFDILNFLEHYKEHPCLWDKSIPEFKDRLKRRQAEEVLLKQFKFVNGKALRSKIRSIRGTYNITYNKVRKSRRCSGSDKVYKPTLGWFEYAHSFLARNFEDESCTDLNAKSASMKSKCLMSSPLKTEVANMETDEHILGGFDSVYLSEEGISVNDVSERYCDINNVDDDNNSETDYGTAEDHVNSVDEEDESNVDNLDNPSAEKSRLDDSGQRRRGKFVADRQTILNVYNYFEKTYPKQSVTFLAKTTAEATQVSLRSVFRIRKEGSEGALLVPRKRLHSVYRNNRYVRYNEDVRDGIRKIVYGLFTGSSTVIVKNILTEVNGNSDLPTFKESTLRRLLNDMGFSFNRNGLVIQDPYIDNYITVEGIDSDYC